MGGVPVKCSLHFRSSFTKHKHTVCSHYGGWRMAGINYKNRKLVPANTEWMVRWSERDRFSLDFKGQVAAKIMKKGRRRKKPNYSSPRWRRSFWVRESCLFMSVMSGPPYLILSLMKIGKAEITTLEGGEEGVRGKEWGKEGKREMDNFSLLWSTDDLT